MKKLILSLLLLTSFVSCDSTTSTVPGDYTPSPYYTCNYQYVYSYTSNQYSYEYVCFWVYYSEDGATTQELDLAANIGDKEQLKLERNANIYASKFGLSYTQAEKIAKNVLDLNSLKERSLEDISDFAEKLYGVNTSDIIKAAGFAQIGDYSELDLLIEKSATKFNTSTETMKAIIKELHGKALEANGIDL